MVLVLCHGHVETAWHGIPLAQTRSVHPTLVVTTNALAGAAAKNAATLKNQKYSALTATHFFVPVAVETLGPWNEDGFSFIPELGRRMSLATGDLRETKFL